MTGAWLLANDLKQISDCTGGRIGDAVRYCQSERINNAEACNAISKADFNRNYISLKEARESLYWIDRFTETVI